MDLQPGLLVTPAIRLAYMLGRGGMGSVWVAEHLRLRVRVVVKFIAAEHMGDAAMVTRFEREAAAAASAKSPHVVQILDFGVTEFGWPFIAMEFLEGEDLGKRLARDKRISPLVYADWLIQACKGLTRTHASGIVHRDIKPENIFLSNVDGEVFVKLLDFGIAKADSLHGMLGGTHTQAFIGTVHYMSPEQTMGAKLVDHRTDLWALGVVTYRALTGVRPFDGEAIGALIESIRTLPIAPPSTHLPELGPPIDAWMHRALARDPQHRFASAREMSLSFVQALNALGHTSVRFFSEPSPPHEALRHQTPRSDAPSAGDLGPSAGSHGGHSGPSNPQTTPPSSITLDKQPRGALEPNGSPKGMRRGVPVSLLVGAGTGVMLALIGTYAWNHLQPAVGPSTRTSLDSLGGHADGLASPPPPVPREAPTTQATVTPPPVRAAGEEPPVPVTTGSADRAPRAGNPSTTPATTSGQRLVRPSTPSGPPVTGPTRSSVDAGASGTALPPAPVRDRPPAPTRPPTHLDEDLR